MVIETGGASVWQNDVVDASKLQRWVYNSEGLQLMDEQRVRQHGRRRRRWTDFLHFAKHKLSRRAHGRAVLEPWRRQRSPARPLTSCMSWTLWTLDEMYAGICQRCGRRRQDDASRWN